MSELKRLAEAATPGPWYTESDGVPQLNNVAHFIHTAERIVAYGQLLEADAAYIAAASPDAILALIEERDRLREALTRLVAVDDAHATLHALDGDDIARMIEHAKAFDAARQTLGKAR